MKAVFMKAYHAKGIVELLSLLSTLKPLSVFLFNDHIKPDNYGDDNVFSYGMSEIIF